VTPSSRLPGFHRLPLAERVQQVVAFAGLDAAETAVLSGAAGLSPTQAELMVENAVGVYGLPLGVATNLQVNGRDYLVPLAIEEPSVIAALSYGARLAREGGGFQAEADAPLMIGQIQLLGLDDLAAARERLLAAKIDLLALADRLHPSLAARGGGARDLQVRTIAESPAGPMLAVHLLYDTRDAMGANVINTALEALTPQVEAIAGGRAGVRVLSNLADRRLARARCVVPAMALAREGTAPDEAVARILEAYALAAVDPYRAATHNKGIMNGIDAAVLASGNDWRAVEAGAHAYAARNGRYAPLSAWSRTPEGDLAGYIELPLAVGTVGGATHSHPVARVVLKILGVAGSAELAQVFAAVGLAQNLAALRALAMEGIQQGHMRFHARQVALAAGAAESEVEAVAVRLLLEGPIGPSRAAAILAEMRGDASRRDPDRADSDTEEIR
jgi:hydroxymethylglutaryl-CoA reductase